MVVLNWNGRDFVRTCLRSLFAQTYPDVRVVVADNASTDGSREIVREEFPEATLVGLPENLHFARGTNAGIEEALRDPGSTYVVTLNNDTRVDPEWLAELVRAAAPESVGVVASRIVFMDRPTVLNSTGIAVCRDGSGVDRGWLQRDEGQFDTAVDVFGASAGAALYRREVLETVGLFDPDFVAYYEDLDLAWRARLAGWTARFAPRAVVYHKYSGSTSPRAIWKTYQGERNRIWNLVQNYPWRHVVSSPAWNAARVVAAFSRRLLRGGDAHGPGGPNLPAYVSAVLRGRIDGYAGLGKALKKRRERSAYRAVDAGTAERWLRTYGVPIRDMPSP